MKQKTLMNCFIALFLSVLPDIVSAQVNNGPIGTALAAELGGNWYIMPTEEGSAQIPFLEVGYVNGRVILSEKDVETGNWIVDREKRVIYTSPTNPLYLYPSSSGSNLTIKRVSALPAYWESFLLNDGREAWRYTQWSDAEERIICMYYKASRGYLAAYIPFSAYQKEPELYAPITDYPIYDGWYRHYDSEYLYATFCPTRDVASVADMSGAEFYALQGKQTGNNGQTELIFEGPCQHLEAGKPYLMKREEATTTVSLLYSGEEVAQPVLSNGMIGSFTGIDAGYELEGKYVLYQNRFVKCAPGSSLIENGAYIDLAAVPEISGTVAQGAVCFSLPGNQGTTGVEKPRFDGMSGIRIYSMDGKLLFQTTDSDWYEKLMPGFYIVNGKKIIK